MYHDICKSYPRLSLVSAKRKTAIAARWREHGRNLDTFRELFTIAEASAFLKGKNGRNWTADFNWLMNSENMAKVLEGNYTEKTRANGSQTGSSFDTDDFVAASFRRSYGRREPQMSSPAEPPKTAADDEHLRERMEKLKAMLAEGDG